jgi:hypothetical protein
MILRNFHGIVGAEKHGISTALPRNMTAAPKFRIDVAINDLLTGGSQRPPVPAEPKGLVLLDPVFPCWE